MKKLLLATALASLAFATAARADSVAFAPWGAYPSVPPEVYVPFPGGSNIVTGDSQGNYLAPTVAGGAEIIAPYLAVEGGVSVKIPVPAEYVVEIYVGTLDSYNHFAFSNNDSWSGADIAGLGIGANDSGSQGDSAANGLLTFTFAKPVTSVTLSSDSNALEVAGVWSSNPVPEPSTWAMMLLGFAGLGYTGLQRARKSRAIA